MSRARWSRKIRRARRRRVYLRELMLSSGGGFFNCATTFEPPMPRCGPRGGRWRPRYTQRLNEERLAAYMRREYGSVVVHSPSFWYRVVPRIRDYRPRDYRPRWQDTGPICLLPLERKQLEVEFRWRDIRPTIMAPASLLIVDGVL